MFDSDIKVMMWTKERGVAVNLALTQFLRTEKWQDWWGRDNHFPFVMHRRPPNGNSRQRFYPHGESLEMKLLLSLHLWWRGYLLVSGLRDSPHLALLIFWTVSHSWSIYVLLVHAQPRGRFPHTFHINRKKRWNDYWVTLNFAKESA